MCIRQTKQSEITCTCMCELVVTTSITTLFLCCVSTYSNGSAALLLLCSEGEGDDVGESVIGFRDTRLNPNYGSHC